MASAMDSLGGQIMCSSSRESMMYQSSHAHKGTPLALSLIADTVLNPSFKHEELHAQRDAAAYELREMNSKPDMFLPEVIHNVAYDNRGLGNPMICPEDRLDGMNEGLLRHTIQEWYRPEKMVIAGAGMPHDELVELTDKLFSSLKSSPTQSRLTSSANTAQLPPHLLSPSSPSVAKSLTRAASYLFPHSSTLSGAIAATPKSPTSTYVGGHRFILDTNEQLNHLYIAFEGLGIEDDDVYTLAVMQVLLGGGGSFSAGTLINFIIPYLSNFSFLLFTGGPGKGMYSRLYTQILNHYPQIDHCASFHHIYTDSSLFGLFASFVPAASGISGGTTPGQILPHLIHQLSLLLYTQVPRDELKRAKNQLTSSLMMALESRAVEVEDLGRQVSLFTSLFILYMFD
jgi:processing peptidase subunit alpha